MQSTIGIYFHLRWLSVDFIPALFLVFVFYLSKAEVGKGIQATYASMSSGISHLQHFTPNDLLRMSLVFYVYGHYVPSILGLIPPWNNAEHSLIQWLSPSLEV